MEISHKKNILETFTENKTSILEHMNQTNNFFNTLNESLSNMNKFMVFLKDSQPINLFNMGCWMYMFGRCFFEKGELWGFISVARLAGD